ncbi:hypothetical protein CLCR_02303 [Cladophialophora carrionii]|uniref:Zn(2)-C6 fungal-type domain-containing protein n=1 Tax=Cladophialophora carrionii TaxID=86049 RepID=A0A1C1CEI6_9EURO|nr:hypothetical protein CLCR_02303 [Cladophialophora carrionii]
MSQEGSAADHEDAENVPRSSPEPPVKRRRPNTTLLGKKKRALTACQFCRLRKTKCDNARPRCSFCQYRQVKCVYADDFEPPTEYDDASQEILSRLSEIKTLLQREGSSVSHENGYHNATPPVTRPSARSEPAVSSPTSQRTQPPHLKWTYASTRCESLLKWPVFRHLVSDEEANIDHFLLDPGVQDDCGSSNELTDSANAAYGRRSFRDIVPLCKRFLKLVHPRNPILDATELLTHAERVVEKGLAWDSPSCLVLIACALACCTQPWEPSTSEFSFLDTDQDAQDPPEDKQAADAYYMAARKRMGLLQDSIIDTQCFFFASIYERYCLRPLRAWFYLPQASSCLQLHLLRRTGIPQNLDPGSKAYLLEQSVFWSCLKAESELVPETGLRPTGLEDFCSSDSFPSPPAIPNNTPSLRGSDQRSWHEQDDEYSRQHEERSWCFYLSEISLRRTINDTLLLLYRNGEAHWMENIHFVLKHAAECEKQIDMWHAHLPEQISFQYEQPPTNELSFYLRGRFQDWREFILRPLLYYVVHYKTYRAPQGRQQERAESDCGIPDLALSLAQVHVSVCADLIVHYSKHKRHGGIWFAARRTFLCALVVLATVAAAGDGEGDVSSGLSVGVHPPQNWLALVTLALQTLSRWSPEAKDVERMRTILQRLFDEVRQREELAVAL